MNWEEVEHTFLTGALPFLGSEGLEALGEGSSSKIIACLKKLASAEGVTIH